MNSPSFAGGRPIIGTLLASRAPVYGHADDAGTIEYALLSTSDESPSPFSFLPILNDHGTIRLLPEYEALGDSLTEVVQSLTQVGSWEHEVFDLSHVKVGYYQDEAIAVYGTVKDGDICFVWFAFGPCEKTRLGGTGDRVVSLRKKYPIAAKEFTFLPELHGICLDVLKLAIKRILEQEREENAI